MFGLYVYSILKRNVIWQQEENQEAGELEHMTLEEIGSGGVVPVGGFWELVVTHSVQIQTKIHL